MFGSFGKLKARVGTGLEQHEGCLNYTFQLPILFKGQESEQYLGS